MAKVSIIIINWNTRDLLEKGLLSVKQSDCGLVGEVIVVDNGSTDSSLEMVKEKFPQVRLISDGQNLGFAKAVNQGIRSAQFDRFFLLNSDAALFPGTLEALSEVLNSEKSIAIVGAQLVYENGALQNSIDHFPNLLTELLNKSLLKLVFPKAYPSKRSGLKKPVEVPSLIGASLLVKREAVDAVGLLDEDYFFFLEETDWCYQLKNRGWKVVFVPEARVLHLQGKSAKKHPVRSKIEFYRSRYHFFGKNYGAINKYVLAIGLIVKALIGLLFTALGTLLTLFLNRKIRMGLLRYSALLLWHILGCPRRMGLSQI